MLQQAQDESELFDDANFAVHDDEVTSDGDEQASTIHRRATEEPLCGTWGCTLANNHFGLHRMPESDQPRKRMKKKQSWPTPEATGCCSLSCVRSRPP